PLGIVKLFNSATDIVIFRFTEKGVVGEVRTRIGEVISLTHASLKAIRTLKMDHAMQDMLAVALGLMPQLPDPTPA
ncbi:MAG: hypothetical protein WAX89_04075, partial [Alphaproteobacteria bacterium]